MIWKYKDLAFFRHMSVLWFLPSTGAFAILWMSHDDTPLALERIIAVLILVFHAYLIYRWLTFPKKSKS